MSERRDRHRNDCVRWPELCFSTGSKTGHKSGKWVIWTRLEVEGELNDVRLVLDLVARVWA